MLTLITGSPGAGKTAYAVNELLNLIDQAKKDKKHRMVIVHGINGLKLPVRRAYCKSESCDICHAVEDDKKRDFLENWHEWVPDNAIVIMDEAQEIFPSYRDSSKEPPEFIRAFHKHRHRGLDFIFLTQHPSFVSGYLQKMCSLHKHLTDSWGRRYCMEYPKVSTTLTESAGVGTKYTYKLPKRVFEQYKSASGHHKLNRKKPAAVYALAVCLVLAVGLITKVVYGVRNKTQDQAQTVQTEQTETATGQRTDKAITHKGATLDFQPRVVGMFETAPAYDGVRKVTEFPHIAGCVKNNKTGDCRCWTQQGTEYPTDLQRCETWIQRPDFNPYRDRSNEVRNAEPVQIRQEQNPPVLVQNDFVPFTGENYP